MRFILLFALVASLSACSQPGVELRAPSSQYKVDTAAGWKHLGTITANKVVLGLLDVEEIDPMAHERSLDTQTPVPPLGAREYYIHAQNTGAPFTKTFTPFLTEAIQNNGRSVKTEPQNAVIINYDAQTYYYGGNGYARRPINYATLTTTAVALGVLTANYSWPTGAVVATAAVAGPIIDALIAQGEITNAEVVLTVSVVSDGRILYQSSEIFYVNPADLPFYWSEYRATPPLETHYFGQDKIKTRTIELSGE